VAGSPKPSLAEFAAAQPNPRNQKWADTLPEDIKDQINAAEGVSSRVIAEWLQALGYAEATYAKIDGFRRDRRRP
jgi:hypothetical protein